MLKRKHDNICLAVFMIVVCGCGRQNDTASDTQSSRQSVTLALNWFAEAEHGGYVAAKELGLFDERGINVVIQQGGPGAPNLVIQELAAGRIKFAVSNADLVVLARSKGVPIVAIAAPLQNSPRCIMVHEASGFKTLHDIADVELAISDSRPFALWMKKELPLTNVTMVPFSGSVGEFLQKPKFAQQGYVFSEPFVAKEKGGDPQVLMLSDIGFNPYASLLVTTETVINDEPNLVQNVVAASLEGWKQYLANPDEINAAINRENSDMSVRSLAFGANAMKPLCETDQMLCTMTLNRWKNLIEQVEQLGEVPKDSVLAADCYDNSFLTNARNVSTPAE